MSIVIESIPSAVPDWHDPSQPDFKEPGSWVGAVVRVKVTTSTSDPAREMADARARLEKKYPGAALHLVQEDDSSYAPSAPNGGTDEDMLRAYFATQQMPEGVTVDQVVHYLGAFLPGAGMFGVQCVAFGHTYATNVLGFENASVDMSKKGLTLVTGVRADKGGKSNGAGKSNWVGLPFLAITGETFKRQEHDEWACRFNDLPAMLDASATLHDGRNLRVMRQRRPAKLRVWVDGAEETMATPAQTQKHIERLTNITWDMLTNAVYIGQHEAASVFGTDKVRKELFSELLGLNRFLDAQARLRKVSTNLQRAVMSLDADIASSDSALFEAHRLRNELAATLKSAPKVDPKTLTALGARLSKLDKDLSAASESAAAYKKSYREMTDKIRAHAADANQARGRHKMLGEQLGRAATVGDVCQLCNGIVDKASIKKYRTKLASDIEAERAAVKKHEGLEESAMLRRDRVEQLINVQDRAAQSARAEQAAAQRQLDALNAQKGERDKLRQRYDAATSRTADLNKIKSVHEGARSATLDERRFVDLCAAACGRDGLPAFLCAAAAPRLSAAARIYCEAFESDVSVVFRPVPDGIDIEVVNEDGGSTYKGQSKGESSLAGIITALAFREALVPLGVLILDEPGEGLDAQSSAAFARGMNRVAERFGAAYVITHNPTILGCLEPNHHIEIVKTGKVSVAREVV